MTGIADVAEVLGGWPDAPVPESPCADGCLKRLRQTLLQLRADPQSAGLGDLAGLIGHLLRREAAAGRGERLRVPRGETWPDDRRWAAAGLAVIARAADSFVLGPGEPWRPDWLCRADDPPPLQGVLAEVPRRNEDASDRPAADPCLRAALGDRFQRFTGPGQRQAVRAAFLLPAGESLLVVLPTGAGKSMVGFAPAVLGRPARGLTLVVAPTVALAFDQASQVRPLLAAAGVDASTPLAWHGDLAEEDRAAVKRAIRDGTQPVLFASPEAVLQSLSPALFDAAQAGLLRTFVVDEAHLVAQWGNDFRPEFQSLAGVRSELLAVCPPHARFRTTLLTATLTSESYVTLKTLFQPLRVVAALHLRPEPTYWIAHAETWEDKRRHVLEACRQVPRPFLLYVSRRKDAEDWAARLRKDGMLRVRHVHGGSRDREEVLAAWRANAVDAVVATSAFGLGMDKRDVRAVIHACVPETLDRFYQEVGRGGRDGRACLSLAVYTDRDLDDAVGLNAERVITVDLGWERWQAMFATRPPSGDAEKVIPLDLNARRPGVRADNDANVGWNLQTLNLLARSGLIRLHAERPPELRREAGEAEEAFTDRLEAAFARYFTTARVEVLGDVHDRAAWEKVVEAERERTASAGAGQLGLMRELLGTRREFSELFCDIYAVDADEDGVWVRTEPACGGCPGCRADGIDRTAYATPRPAAPPGAVRDADPRLRQALDVRPDARLAVVTYPRPGGSGRDRRRWQDTVLAVLLPRVIALGVRELSASAAWAELPAYRLLYFHCPDRYLIHQDPGDPDDDGWPVPRLSLLDPADPPPPVPAEWIGLDRPLHVLVIPEDACDPDRPGSAYRDRYSPTPLETLLARLDR